MIWLAVVFFPLFPAALLGVAGTRRLVCRHGMWVAPLPALALALAGSGLEPAVVPALFLQSVMHFGPFGQLFLLLTAVLWTAAGLFAGASFAAEDSRQSRFALFFLFSLCGNLGLCVAQDLASFYVFFALMSFSAYGLIVHEGTEKALHAGRVYLTMAVIGEVLLASAFFYAGLAGPGPLFSEIRPLLPLHVHGPLILVLAFTGFGIKAGVLLLHVWLPLAHPAAPTPASAVLSGAMIKAGLLGWLQLFAMAGDLDGWGLALAGVGLAAAFYGVLCGVGRQDPKTILAYSSVSQMGLMTMVLGFALLPAAAAAEGLVPGLLIFVLVHGLAKGALFLGVGVAKAAGRKTPRSLLVLAGLLLAGLVLAGLPFTAGAVVKQALKAGAGLLPEAWRGVFDGLIALSAVGTMLLLGTFLWRVRDAMPAADKAIPSGMVVAWAGLLGLVLLALPLAGMVLPLPGEGVPSGMKPIVEGLWPIGLGLLGAGLYRRLSRGGAERQGLDALLLAGLEGALRAAWLRLRAGGLGAPESGSSDPMGRVNLLLNSRWVQRVSDRIEERLLAWPTVGVVFVGLLLGFVFLAWRGVA
ncbi:MAG TPA: complex I subunit 5 family protein [Desulfobacterales bacterium]|nr:complex I subunit 5 family protein [Desulfobacterales bacterium]